MSGSEFHQHGHHVQKAHGRRSGQLAADGSHLSGGMIALMPAPADAKRLALKGGEAAADLHCTLFFLGDDGAAFTHVERNLIIDSVRLAVEGVPEIRSNIFGVAHWNAGGDHPSWVWNVGDAPETDLGLEDVHDVVDDLMEDIGLPDQHTPWAAHICAAYTEDLSLIGELEKRLGPVTFDRVRVSFGSDDTDIPLSGTAVTAAGDVELRRKLTPAEVSSCCDFAGHQAGWESAVDSMVTEYAAFAEKWRTEIREQITAFGEDIGALDRISVSTGPAAAALYHRMHDLAEQSGKAQQNEAEQQGVTVPEWSLDSDALTAALSGRDLIRAISRAKASVLGSSLVTSAKRTASRLFGGGRTGAGLAAEVDNHLISLSQSYPREIIGEAMTSAQNIGRMAVLQAAPPTTSYASEILDKNTCGPCKAIDGTEFTSLTSANDAYPGGGYALCQGGGRCRGTLISVWGMAETASAAPPTDEGTAIAVTVTELGGKPNPGTKKDKRLHENDMAMDCPDGEDCGDMAATLGEAVEQALAAKVSAAGDAAPVDIPADQTAPWRGPIAAEGVVTGDGREFEAGKLTWADLPLPLRWNKEDSHGGEAHTVAVNVGRIDRIWRDGSLIMAEGVLNLAEPDGQRVHDMIKGEFIRGVSIDADSISDADVEYVMPEGTGGADDGEPDLFEMLFAQPEKVIFHGGRIRGATLCDIPAFVEAYIALVDTEGAVTAGGRTHPEMVPAPGRPERRIDGLTAAAGTDFKPPAAWFLNPQLSAPTGIQVSDSGRVYGHAAQWGTCHIGQQDVCVQPPHEDSHPYYMTGEVITDNGRAAVGQITVGTGHAPLSYGAQPATEHYEHTGHAVADVAVGNDEHGIWVAGAIRPGADPLLVHELRASGQVSGDWRRIGSSLRLVGLLAVNIPGFPVPRLKARVASGRQEALVAAGRPTVLHGKTEEETIQQAFRTVMDMLFSRVHEGR